MTYLEYIRSLSDSEIARFLCKFKETAGCEHCPANNLCHWGDNGMGRWLGSEVEDDG